MNGENERTTNESESVAHQRSCSALDWLAVALRQLENAVCEMSPDPNSARLLTCRTALRNAETIIERMKPKAEWEGRPHGSQEWEDIWPEHDGQMSYGADITYVEIRRKGADALT